MTKAEFTNQTQIELRINGENVPHLHSIERMESAGDGRVLITVVLEADEVWYNGFRLGGKE